MKVRIHRGTREIGGNCIELNSEGKSILLDLGMPLTIDNQEKAELPDIPGLKDGDNSDLLGIVISHPHQDHYGLVPKVHDSIPIYIGKAAYAMLEASSPFSPFGLTLEIVRHYENQTQFTIGPFKITPFLNDHSAYDAYSLLIEADGKTLFYTGDFRTHGRKPSVFNQLLKDGPKNVDVLLMEGTNIGRGLDAEKTVNESELEKKIETILENTKGITLAWFSGQNIDRFVTFYKATKRSSRTMIVDLYIAHILEAINNPSIPSPRKSDIRVFLPSRMRNKIIREKNFDLVSPYYDKRIYSEEITDNAGGYLMTFRPVMCHDLEKAACLSDSSLIYSMWEGYLDQGKEDIRNWCKVNSIRFEMCHTSGHSDIKGMQELAVALTPKRLVPIHSFKPELFEDYLFNVEQKEDGQWWQVE